MAYMDYGATLTQQAGPRIRTDHKEYADSPEEAACERKPQIASALDLLRTEIEHHDDCIGRLLERLQPAMSLAGPTMTGNCAEGRVNEPTCALAATITQAAHRIRNSSQIITDALSRLEV